MSTNVMLLTYTSAQGNIREGLVRRRRARTNADLQAAFPAPGADPLVAAACCRANEVAPHLADAIGCTKNPRTPAVAARPRTTDRGNVTVELKIFMASRERERERERHEGQNTGRASSPFPSETKTPLGKPRSAKFENCFHHHTKDKRQAMGLRERFLTAGAAVPLALWAIFYDARLCLSLVLVLQAICVQELHGLLRRTR